MVDPFDPAPLFTPSLVDQHSETRVIRRSLRHDKVLHLLDHTY